MNFKEIDFGAWGWYFDNPMNLTLDAVDFFRKFILISLKYGINLSTFGKSYDLNSFENVDILVEKIVSTVENCEGNEILKIISRNFYSKELSASVFSSVYYSNQTLDQKASKIDDTFSMFFCTTKENELYSFYYNLRTDIFYPINDDILILNTTRFNSYIRSLHQLMKFYDVTLFDFSLGEENLNSEIDNKGYILHKNECLFYEDVYDLLQRNQKYKLFEKVNISFDK